VLVLATDGIRPNFMPAVVRQDPPQRVAEAILEQHWTRGDDGLVLVVRYQGAAP
jgi:hypothetical protein